MVAAESTIRICSQEAKQDLQLGAPRILHGAAETPESRCLSGEPGKVAAEGFGRHQHLGG